MAGERPDIYLHELADIFDCSGQAISLALKKMGITRKKRVLPTVKNLNRRERNI